ncbi:MAG: Holliday junction resolvase RecU [Bacilli bacterium]|nr:Holliday junction resolvase RecU [Bacilli bacterium]
MKYPVGSKTKNSCYIEYSNRGMGLEDDLNITNEQYRINDIAFIYKKPTPVTISKVEFNNKKEPIIKEGFYKKPSTTDYNGLYNGLYIDFEAKETKSKSFPLSNIHQHQIKHLQNISKHKGFSFLIIKFVTENKIFLLEEKKLTSFIDNEKRKSIPLEYFMNEGYLIKEKFSPRIDYLEIINKIILKEK